MNPNSTDQVVNIKWNKETLIVPLVNNETVDSLRQKIYLLTHIPLLKQKIMFKGKALKEGNLLLESFGISNVSLLVILNHFDGNPGIRRPFFTREFG